MPSNGKIDILNKTGNYLVNGRKTGEIDYKNNVTEMFLSDYKNRIEKNIVPYFNSDKVFSSISIPYYLLSV